KTMQIVKIDGTTYRVKFDRDPLELAKAARKPYKTKKPKDIRKFPTYTPAVSTAEYIKRFDSLNFLQAVQYAGASTETAAQYDSTIPLFEVLNDE
ncbi:MAG: hypothetical protein ACK55I_40650, partial [bacterium]